MTLRRNVKKELSLHAKQMQMRAEKSLTDIHPKSTISCDMRLICTVSLSAFRPSARTIYILLLPALQVANLGDS